MVLPSGSTLPPLPYLLGVLGAAIAVIIALYDRDVGFDQQNLLAFAPWMVAGSAFYALYQIGAAPGSIAPLFSSPTVYVTTGVLAGAAWVFTSRFDATNRWLAIIGVLAAIVPIAYASFVAFNAGTFTPGWSLFGAVVAVGLTAGIWRCFGWYTPEVSAHLGAVGALAIFAHVLDGVSTTIGVDVLQFGEQTPLSAFLLEVGGALPTEPYLGSGWVFLMVKVVIALGLVYLLDDLVRDDPTRGYALLLLVTAVGLGPASYNLVFFAVAGPAGI